MTGDPQRPGPATPAWRKSSFSINGDCVEVALGEQVGVRNSRDPDGPVLSFTRAEFAAFLLGVKNAEFDPAGPEQT